MVHTIDFFTIRADRTRRGLDRCIGNLYVKCAVAGTSTVSRHSVCPLLPESIRYSQRMEFKIRSLSKPDSVQATIRPRFNGLAVVLVPRYGVVRAPQRVAVS